MIKVRDTKYLKFDCSKQVLSVIVNSKITVVLELSGDHKYVRCLYSGGSSSYQVFDAIQQHWVPVNKTIANQLLNYCKFVSETFEYYYFTVKHPIVRP